MCSVTLDKEAKQVYVGSMPMNFGPVRQAVLEELIEHPRRPYHELNVIVDGLPYIVTRESMRMIATEVRRVLGPEGVHLKTRRGFGWHWEPDHTIAAATPSTYKAARYRPGTRPWHEQKR